jgi:hypothetical protein
LLGGFSEAILVFNAGFPQIIEVMASLAIAWANLSYRFVPAPISLRRLVRGRGRTKHEVEGSVSLGCWGPPVTLPAAALCLVMVANIGWPRTEIYGISYYRR